MCVPQRMTCQGRVCMLTESFLPCTGVRVSKYTIEDIQAKLGKDIALPCTVKPVYSDHTLSLFNEKSTAHWAAVATCIRTSWVQSELCLPTPRHCTLGCCSYIHTSWVQSELCLPTPKHCTLGCCSYIRTYVMGAE